MGEIVVDEIPILRTLKGDGNPQPIPQKLDVPLDGSVVNLKGHCQCRKIDGLVVLNLGNDSIESLYLRPGGNLMDLLSPLLCGIRFFGSRHAVVSIRSRQVGHSYRRSKIYHDPNPTNC